MKSGLAGLISWVFQMSKFNGEWNQGGECKSVVGMNSDGAT